MDQNAVRLRSVQLRQSLPVSRRFRICLFALAAVWMISVAVLIRTEGMPPIKHFLPLAALIVVAENRDLLFGDETSISGSIVVGIAAAFVFQGFGPMIGPLLVASCAGIYWPHIRDRQFAKMIVNGAGIGMSALAGAAVFQVSPSVERMSVAGVLAWAAPVAFAYWLVNSCVLAAAATSLRGGSFRRMGLLLLRSEKSAFGFAILGGACGALYVRDGVVPGVGSLLALLAVFDFVVLTRASRLKPAGLPASVFRQLPLVGTAAAAWALGSSMGPGIAVLTGVALTFSVSALTALLRFRRASGSWEPSLAIGIAIAEWPVLVIAVVAGVFASEFGVLVALGLAAIAFTVEYVLTDLLRRRRDVVSPSDEELLDAIELALLDRPDRAPSSF